MAVKRLSTIKTSFKNTFQRLTITATASVSSSDIGYSISMGYLLIPIPSRQAVTSILKINRLSIIISIILRLTTSVESAASISITQENLIITFAPSTGAASCVEWLSRMKVFYWIIKLLLIHTVLPTEELSETTTISTRWVNISH